jgi:hypothetical protein
MMRDERDRLLARYTSGELTPVERERLFTEALTDQELFNELFEEDALSEALEDPEVRRAIMALEPPRRSSWALRWRWAAVGALAASLVFGVIIVRRQVEPETEPMMVARALPAPVTRIEPEPAPLPDRLDFPAPGVRAPEPGGAAATSRTPSKREAAGAVPSMAMDTEKAIEMVEAPTGRPESQAALASAGLPFTALVEYYRPEGGWRAAEGLSVPEGAPLRLSVTAGAPVMISAAGVRALVLPESPRHFALPAYAAGEHEIPVEWTAGPPVAEFAAPRARLMSEAGKNVPGSETRAAGVRPSVFRVRIRVE